jgi:hypothetical protein
MPMFNSKIVKKVLSDLVVTTHEVDRVSSARAKAHQTDGEERNNIDGDLHDLVFDGQRLAWLGGALRIPPDVMMLIGAPLIGPHSLERLEHISKGAKLAREPTASIQKVSFDYSSDYGKPDAGVLTISGRMPGMPEGVKFQAETKQIQMKDGQQVIIATLTPIAPYLNAPGRGSRPFEVKIPLTLPQGAYQLVVVHEKEAVDSRKFGALRVSPSAP